MEVIDKPTKQPTAQRQAGLVEAALLLAAQRSPADITTADLAQAVGISQGAVFRHFASKEAVWLAVLDWVTGTLLARLQAAARGATPAAPNPPHSRPPLVALRAVFLAHVDFVVAHPGVPRVIFQELQSHGDTPLKARVRSLMQQYRELILQLLQQALATRAIAPDTALPAAAVLFIGSVQGLVMQSLLSCDVAGMAAQAPGVFAIYQRGLMACPPDSQGTP